MTRRTIKWKGFGIFAVMGTTALIFALPIGAEEAAQEARSSGGDVSIERSSNGRRAFPVSAREARAKEKAARRAERLNKRSAGDTHPLISKPLKGERTDFRLIPEQQRKTESAQSSDKPEKAFTQKDPRHVTRRWYTGDRTYAGLGRDNIRWVSSAATEEEDSVATRDVERSSKHEKQNARETRKSRGSRQAIPVEQPVLQRIDPREIKSEMVDPSASAAPAQPVVDPRAYRPDAQPTSAVQMKRSSSHWQERLRERIRHENSQVSQAAGAAPEQSVVHVPGGRTVKPRVVHRPANTVIHANYKHISPRFGHPGYRHTLVPRLVNTYSVGYWLRYDDGRSSAGVHYGVPHHRHQHYRHRRPVSLVFYYPYYFDDPYYTGFWYAGYYPSVYYYYGWLPRWCNPPGTVIYRSDPYPFYYSRYSGYGWPSYYYYSGAPRLDRDGVDRALVDIRYAWLEGDIDRLAYYIRQDEKISVYFDNDYSYSLSADDYYTMTLDAMSTVKTLDMVFSEPTWINSLEIFVTGRHIFRDPDDEHQTVYVSYRLHRYGGKWYIIGIGSSPNPIRNIYKDFRYDDYGYRH
ncbi:MAG: hypothetical protein GTO55_06950 [Armatimonadetes bacterium]|nr:hypothetical protein [Armatimonadota bacterium]NIM24012.1 hypothetical protein [Armatimonadota bacterium]NIM67862.1 hypothetical protein [Armatimonadota bacterium]NIM76393.1 hypothetical protein [Armatimonadota bacterium]NIN06092.1 hypothetical protein [Armatimonadota bacterium]